MLFTSKGSSLAGLVFIHSFALHDYFIFEYTVPVKDYNYDCSLKLILFLFSRHTDDPFHFTDFLSDGHKRSTYFYRYMTVENQLNDYQNKNKNKNKSRKNRRQLKRNMVTLAMIITIVFVVYVPEEVSLPYWCD